MIYKEHTVELYINGQKADLESQKSLNLRFQNVLFDPEKITSTQAEYSFEFELPSTPVNDKIFDYANNLSKTGKFRSRLNAEVYADGKPIFNGTLTLNSYKEKKYSCNLVSVKVYSLDDIFGDSVLSDIDNWKMDFNGVETINEKNMEIRPDVIFPLVSYGAFQKKPYNSDEVGNEYTSKYDIDEYNRWYVESFAPSLNMLELIKHCFNYKGYSITGNIFTDPFLNKIYLSSNYAEEQSPDYNVGNQRFGKADITVSNFKTTYGDAYEQELNFPYFQVYCPRAEGGPETNYNWEAIDVFNIMMSGGTVTVNNTPNYMYQPDECVVVIPADGWYKIELSANTTINTTGNISAGQYIVDMNSSETEFENVTMPVGINEVTPIEIQLVRNYDDNIELIKGKDNRRYINGNCTESAYTISGVVTRDNIKDWQTCFPHEDPYSADLPTEANDLTSRNRKSILGGNRSDSKNTSEGSTSSNNSDTSESGNFSGRRGGTRGGTIGTGTIQADGGGRNYSPLDYGYVYNNGELMAFDQVVTDSFICGLSSLSSGTPAVMKNGHSWSPLNAEKNEIFAPVYGYSMLSREAGTGNLVTEQTDHNSNTYINTPISWCRLSGNTMSGFVSCMVWLNKNDILQLMTIQRAYTDEIGNKICYSSTTNAHLVIEAFSNRSQNDLIADHDNRYEAPVEFDDKLNLANFLNKEKKISEWVSNIIDAYNLELVQDGTTIQLNTKKKFNRNLLAAVDIDDRCNSADAEASKIDYPKSMAVRYKIDTDEHGFYESVPEDKIDLPDWKKYGDSGFTVVELNDDTYTTTTSDKNLQFSYTWYDDFNWYAVNSGFTKTSTTPITLTIPVISKEEYMIDGYDYTESLKHDGYSLAQRFWWKPRPTSMYVWTRTYPAERVMIYEPINLYTNYRDIYLNLSYKNTENSILTQYFNLAPYLASNYVEIEAYISPDEYNMIKNGALIRFDKDLYYPVEINGYDPSGYNPTEIKMMKKL